ncbi:LamG-like jellyroll fold domain-containing protein [Endozoicomonas elysicola]|uniref:LamG-like jellyroll fold domain-containing protein n=1 Tax=Endozoicomonas elysicola TaxID=305900 RepID=UPI001F2E0F5D|nr:LamG-like jellyroll fold domain-containing protein [Endozoicomonas elysicola]
MDSTTLQSATVQITGNYSSSEDILAFTDQNGITGSWDSANGTLTLSGSATLADYETALESVSYQNTANDRSTAQRTLSITVNDGVENSTAATADINVSQFNQIPGVLDQNYSLSLTGNATDYLIANPVSGFPSTSFTIETWVKTSGVDESIFSYASSNSSNEILLFGAQELSITIGNTSIYTDINIADDNWHHVAWSWDSASGSTKIFIDGTEQYNGTLKQGYTIADGGALVFGQEQDSLGGGFQSSQAYDGLIRDIRVWNADRTQTDINNQKDSALTGTESNLVSYYPMSGGSGDVVDAGPARNDLQRFGANWEVAPRETNEDQPLAINTISFSDADSGSDTVEVTLTITNGTLQLASISGVTITAGADNSATMTLQGNLADLNAAINGIQYQPTSNFHGTATLSASINDLGNADSADAQSSNITRTITVNSVNDAALITGDDSATLAEDNSSTLTATGTLSITDVDAGESIFTAATVNGSYGSLTIDTAGAWSYSADNTQTVIQQLASGQTLTDTITVSSVDGTAHNLTFTFNGTNDAPTLSLGDPSTGGGSGLLGEIFETSSSINDLTDLGNVVSNTPTATFTATNLDYSDAGTLAGFLGNDANTLSTDIGNNTMETIGFRFTGFVKLDAGQHDFTVTSDDGFRLNIAGQNISEFFDTRPAEATTGSYTAPADGFYSFELIYWENGGGETLQVTSSATGGAVLSANNILYDTIVSYTENDPGDPVADNLELTELDVEDIQSATVSISEGYAASEDALNFTSQNGITGNWDATTGILTLTGNASPESYQAALRSITYSNNSDSPDTTGRVISLTVSDGQVTSNEVTRGISITAVNDGPQLVNNTLSISEGSTVVLGAENLSATDLDHNNNSLTFILSNIQNGSLTGATDNGDGTFSFTQQQLLDGNISFTHDGSNSAPSYQVTLTDGPAITAASASTINFTEINDAPVFDSTVASLTRTVNTQPVGNGDTFVSLNSHASDFAGMSTGAISMWVKLDAGQGSATLFSTGDASSATTQSWLVAGNSTSGLNDESLTFYSRIGDNHLNIKLKQGEDLLFDDQWHHIAVVVDGTDNRIYLDGQRASVEFSHGSVTTSQFTGADTDLVNIGSLVRNGAINGSIPTNGEITDVGIFTNTSDLTDTNINALMNQGPDYFDNSQLLFSTDFAGTGNTVTDTSGNGRDATAFTGSLATRSSLTILNVDEDNSEILLKTDLLYGFSDADGDTLSIQSLSVDTGTITDHGDDTWTYTPPANFHGTATFTIQVSDGALSVTADKTITVTSINDVPTSLDKTVIINEDSSHTFSTADFAFSDQDTGDSLQSITITSLPAAGTLELNSSPVTLNQVITATDISTLVFTPAAHANGNGYASFGFTISDGLLSSNAHTLTVDVTPVNDAPNAVDESDTVSHVAPISGNLLTNDSDIEGDNLTVSTINGQAIASIGNTVITGERGEMTVAADGSWSYTLDSEYGGLDLNDSLVAEWNFDETNGSTATDTAPYDAHATDGTLSGNTAFVGGLSGNAISLDGSGDLVHISDSSEINTYSGNINQRSINLSFKIDASNDLSGTQILYEEGGSTNGFVVYIHNCQLYVGAWSEGSGWNGEFLNTALTSGDTDWHTVALVLDSSAGTLNGYLDGEVFASGTGEAVHFHTDDGAFGGLWGGSKIHTGDLSSGSHNFHGLIDSAKIYNRALSSNEIKLLSPDAFTYEVFDGTDTSTATIYINAAENHAPTSSDNTLSLDEDNSHTFTASEFNFNDVDAGDTMASVKITQLPISGSLTLNGESVSANQIITTEDIPDLVFTPEADANGVGYTSLQFSVIDSGGLESISQTITLNVDSVNDAPSDIHLTNTFIAENAVGAVIGTLTTTDIDASTESFGIHEYTVSDSRFEVVNNQLKLKDGQSLNFEVDGSTLDITVTSTDDNNSGLSYNETFTLNIGNLNEPPAISSQTFTVNENTATDGSVIVGQVVAQDVDAGDALTYSILSGNNEGRFAINETTGDISVVNGLNHETKDVYNLIVQVQDSQGDSQSAAVAINIADVNEAPEQDRGLQNQSSGISASVGGQFSYQIPANAFKDQDLGDPLSFSVSGMPSGLVFNPVTRTIAGIPASTEVGDHTITVTVTDDDGLTASDTFTMRVGNAKVLEESFDNDINLAAEAGINSYTITSLPNLGTVKKADGTEITINDVLTSTELEDLLYDAPKEYDNVSDLGQLSYQYQDGGTQTKSVRIVVEAVNDVPEITGPGSKDTSTLSLNSIDGVYVEDDDIGSEILEVTLSVNSGKLFLGNTEGLEFVSGGNGESSMTIRGRLSQGPEPQENFRLTFSDPDNPVFDQRTEIGGTLSGASRITDPVQGGVIEFDSNSDRINLSESYSLGSEWTISTRFKDLYLGNGAIGALARSNSGDTDIHIEVSDSGALGTRDRGSNTFHSSGYDMSSLDNDWHTLTAVGQNGKTHFYIDGQHVGTSNYQSQEPIDAIGNGNDSQNYPFARYLDDFRVYDSAVVPQLNLDTTTGADQDDFHLNFSDQTNASQDTEHNIQTTFTGVERLDDDDKGGIIQFDANSDMITFDDPFDLASEWTITTEFKDLFLNNNLWNTLVRGETGDHHIIVHYQTGELGVYDNSNSAFRGSGFFMNNLGDSWHTLTAVGKDGKTFFYLDNEHVGTSNYQSTIDIKAIGNYQSGDQPFAEYLDNFRIFNKALEPDHINLQGPVQKALEGLAYTPDSDATGDTLTITTSDLNNTTGVDGTKTDSHTVTLNVAQLPFPIEEDFTTSPSDWSIQDDAVHQSSVTGATDGGLLQLTGLSDYETGFSVLNTPFSSSLGIQVEFDYFAGGGTAADGMLFFLADGSQSTVTAGASGGGMGYSPFSGTGTNGLSGAYMGIGFDEYGNFAGDSTNRKDSVVIRDGGNGTTGYGYLSHYQVSSFGGIDDTNITTDSSGDGNGYDWRKVRLTLDSEQKLTLEMSWDNGSSWETLYDQYDYGANTSQALPDTFKLGFTGATGGANNYHWVDNVSVKVPADLSVTNPVEPANAAIGDEVSWEFAIANTGDNHAFETGMTWTAPTGLENTSWTYTTSNGQTGSGTGNIDTRVDLLKGETAAFTVTGTLTTAAVASLGQGFSATLANAYSGASGSNTYSTTIDTDILLLNMELSTDTIAEMTYTGDGSVKVADINVTAGDTVNTQLTLSGADADKFTIIDNNGQPELHVNQNITLDFETESRYDLTITLTDNNGNSAQNVKPVTIKVADINELPTDILLPFSNAVDLPTPQASWELRSNLNDDAGSVNGSFSGGSPVYVDGPGGAAGSALQFDGSNDHFTASLNVSETSYAVALWFKTDSANGGIFQVDGGGHDRNLWLENGQLKGRLWSSGEIITSTDTFNDGEWHQVVHTFGGSADGQKIYVDGVEVASGSSDVSNFTSQTSISLGYTAYPSGNQYFEGEIASVQVYSQGLTTTQIASLYQGEARIDEWQDGAEVGPVYIIDPDSPEGAFGTHNYTLSDNRFTVENGILKLKAGETINADTETSISLDITASDNGGLSITRSLTIAVNDLPPVAPEINSISLNNDFQSVITGTGQPDTTLNFTINSINYSATVASDGTWSFTPPVTLNNGDPLTIRVTSTDGGGNNSPLTEYNATVGRGDGEDNTLTGGTGIDLMEGGAGSDQISGGAGDDIIQGNQLNTGGRYDELLENSELNNFTTVTDHGNYRDVILNGWKAVNTASIINTSETVDATLLPQIETESWNASALNTITDTSKKVTLDAVNNVDGIVQSFSTVDDATYTVTVEASPRATDSSDFEIWWDGVHIQTITLNQTGWQTFTVSVIGDGTEQSVMLREVPSQNTTVGPMINSVSVTGLLADGSGNSGELLTNGNFATDTSSWRAVSTGSITNAQYTSGVDVNSLPNGDWEVHSHSTSWVASSDDTTSKLELDGNNTDVDAIYQQVDTLNGETYTLSFEAYTRLANSGDVEIWWGDQYEQTVSIGTSWATHTVNLSGDGTRQTLMIREVSGQNDGQGTILNNVSLQGVLPEVDTLEGGAGNDTIASSSGNDIITGGADNDTVTTGAGRDRLVWQPGDEGTVGAPATDRITDFAVGASGDILDLHAFLTGEESTALDQFLHFRLDGSDTVIDVSRTAGGDVVQHIVLENVDLTALGNTNAEILSQLQSNGQLITTHTLSINTPVMDDNQISAEEENTVLVTGVGEPGATVELTIRSDSVPAPQAGWSLNGNLNGDSTVTFNGGSASYVDGPNQGSQDSSRQALHFDGVNDSLTGNLNVSETDYAVSFWIKTTDSNARLFTINGTDGSQGAGSDRYIDLVNGQIRASVWDSVNGHQYITGANQFDDGEWHHVVHTYGSSIGGQRLYVDGVELASGPDTQSDFGWQASFNFGNGDYLGDAAGLEIFNASLTADDVSALYNTAVKTINVDADGTWSLAGEVLDIDQLSDGQLEITATQTDNTNTVSTVTQTVTFSGNVPTLSMAEVVANTQNLVLTFSEDMDINSIPALADFAVSVDSSTVNVLNVSYLNSTQIRLSLDSAVSFGANVQVSYTPGNDPVQEQGGINPFAVLTNFSATVTPDGVAPVRQDMTVDGDQLIVNYNENLDSANLPDSSAFTISLIGGGSRTVSNVSISGSQMALTLDSPVIDADIVRLSYSAANATNNGGAAVQDAQGNTSNGFAGALVENNTDTTPPTLNSAVVDGDIITLTYSEELNESAGLMGVEWGAGKNGHGTGLEFNGFEGTGEIDGLSIGGTMTLAAWVRYDDFSQTWSRIFDFGDGDGDDNIVMAHIGDSSDLRFSVRSGTGTEYPVDIEDFFTLGEWVHIAATVSSNGTLKVYKNGTFEAETTGAAVPPVMVRANNYVGKSNWSHDDPMDGAIDDILIVDRDLSSTEISDLYNASDFANFASGLTGDTYHAYDFEEGGGTTASDLNSNSQPMTLTGDSIVDVQVGGVARNINGTSVSGNKVILELASPVTDGESVTLNYKPKTTADFQSGFSVGTGGTASLNGDTLTLTSVSDNNVVLINTLNSANRSDDLYLDFAVTPTDDFGSRNAFIVFDYVNANDFKAIGSYDGSGTSEWRILHFVNGTATTKASNNSSDPSNFDVSRHTEVTIVDNKVTLIVDGDEKIAHQFSENISAGELGVMNIAGSRSIYTINRTQWDIGDNSVNSDSIEDLRGFDAVAFNHGDVAITNITDSISPNLNSAEINGSTLILTLNEELNTSTTLTPSLFTVLAEGQSKSISNIAIHGHQVTLTLNEPVIDGQQVSIDYNAPAASNDLNSDRIEDSAGNDVANVSSFTVTNTTDSDSEPDVTRIFSDDANQWYQSGNTVTVKIQFSERVEVSGQPTLLLETGTLDRLATYSSGSGTDTLSFTYTIESPDESADLSALSTTALSLNGGTITDLIGNNASLTLPNLDAAEGLAQQNTIQVDSVIPTVGLTDNSVVNEAGVLVLTGGGFNSLLSPGEMSNTDLTSRLDWTKLSWRIVNNSGSNTDIIFTASDISSTLAVNDQELYIKLDSSKLATMRATAGFGNAGGQDLIRITSDGFFQDAAGNTMSDANTAGVEIFVLPPDGAAPSITSVSNLSADGEFASGSVIRLQVNFDEPVEVTGEPILLMGTGNQISAASFSSGSGTQQLVFEYTIQAGDETPDLDVHSPSALQLNGGSIKDLSGNNAVLMVPVVETLVDFNAADLMSKAALETAGWSFFDNDEIREGDIRETTLTAVDTQSFDDNIKYISLDGEGSTAEAFLIQDYLSDGASDLPNMYYQFTSDELESFKESGFQISMTVMNSGSMNISLGDPAAASTNNRFAFEAGIPDDNQFHDLIITGHINTNNALVIDSYTVDGSNATYNTVNDGRNSAFDDFTLSVGAYSSAASGVDKSLLIKTIAVKQSDINALAEQADLRVDGNAPEVSITGVTLSPEGSDDLELTLSGSGFSTLLGSDENTGISLQGNELNRFDWDNLIIKLKQPDDSFDNIRLNASDVGSVRVHSNQLEIVIDDGVDTILGNNGFSTINGDVTLTINPGFIGDQAGNRSSTDALTDATVDVTTSGASVLSVSADTEDGSYNVGDEIVIRVRFSEKVTLQNYDENNDPLLLLLNDRQPDSGNPYGGNAVYVSGSGTREFVFRHTLSAGENIDDLNYRDISSLTFNNAFIGLPAVSSLENGAGNDVNLTLPTTNSSEALAGNSQIVVDTSLPTTTITSVAYDEDNNQLLLQGSNFDQLLNNSESATSDITARLDWSKLVIDIDKDDGVTQNVTISASDINSTRLAGSDTLTIQLTDSKASELENVFGYKGAEDGIDIQAGFLRDLAGNENTVSTSDLTLDYSDIAAPTVLQVRLEESGNYKPGDEVAILVELSEVVNISGVNLADNQTRPSLALDNGATALYDSGAGSNTLKFIYTVGSGNSENSSNLNYSTISALSIPSGTMIFDAAGNSLVTTLPALNSNDALAQTSTGTIDVNAPDIQQIQSLTADGDYNAGKVIQIEVAISEAVNVTGSPALNLNTGGQATYASGSGSDKLVFNYTIPAGHNVSDLDVSSLSLTGATIRDLSGNDLNAASLPTGSNGDSLASQADITVDTSAPSFSITNFFFWAGYFEFDSNQTWPGSNGESLTNTYDIDWSKLVISGTDDFDNPTSYFFNEGDIDFFTKHGGINTRATLKLTTDGYERFQSWEGFSYFANWNGEQSFSQDMNIRIDQGWLIDSADNNSTLELADQDLKFSTYRRTDSANLAELDAISSTTANGIYKVGDVINITVSFNQKVIVDTSSGTPTLTLNNGQTATLVESDDTKSRVFNFSYTIQAGDSVNSLNVTTINTNGGRFYGDGGPNSGTVDVSSTAINGLSSEATMAGSKEIHIDTTNPASTITSAQYDPDADVLTLNGTGFNDILSANASAESTELRLILDWSKLSYDVNGSLALSFTKDDVLSAKVVDNTRLSIELAAAKGVDIESNSGGDYSNDQIDIGAGFIKDLAGNTATTDALVSGSVTQSDLSAPNLSSSLVSGNELVLDFSEAISGAPTNTEFTVKVDGVDRVITSITVSGQEASVTFDGNQVGGDEQLLFSYTGNSLGDSAGNTIDTISDRVAGFSHTSGNTLKTLIGDVGDDFFIINHDDVTATGGYGADTFDFNINGNSQNPADLVITDFSTDEGDLLKLDDILVDASDSLDQHFHFVTSGSDTIMEIRPEADGDVTKRVTFKDVDLFTLGSNDTDILNNLINNNNLDHGDGN